MNIIGIAWNVVECEVTFVSWYERKQGELAFMVIVCLLIMCSLRDMVLMANCSLSNYAANPPSTINLGFDLQSMSVTIMSKGGELKCDTILKLCFISSRNACVPGPLDVPSTRKHVGFAYELEASSSRSKIFDLGCFTPPSANVDVKLTLPRGLPHSPEPTIHGFNQLEVWLLETLTSIL